MKLALQALASAALGVIFFALLQLLTQGRALAPAEQPVQAPPPRIHLKNCVFRE